MSRSFGYLDQDHIRHPRTPSPPPQYRQQQPPLSRDDYSTLHRGDAYTMAQDRDTHGFRTRGDPLTAHDARNRYSPPPSPRRLSYSHGGSRSRMDDDMQSTRTRSTVGGYPSAGQSIPTMEQKFGHQRTYRDRIAADNDDFIRRADEWAIRSLGHPLDPLDLSKTSFHSPAQLKERERLRVMTSGDHAMKPSNVRSYDHSPPLGQYSQAALTTQHPAPSTIPMHVEKPRDGEDLTVPETTTPSGHTRMTHSNGKFRITDYVLQTVTDQDEKLGSIRSLFHVDELLDPKEGDPVIDHPIIFTAHTYLTAEITLDHNSIPAFGPNRNNGPDRPICGRSTFIVHCQPMMRFDEKKTVYIVPHCIIEGALSPASVDSLGVSGASRSSSENKEDEAKTTRSVVVKDGIYFEAQSFPNTDNILSLRRGKGDVESCRYLKFRCGVVQPEKYVPLPGGEEEDESSVGASSSSSVKCRFLFTGTAKVKFVELKQ
jgi:hypothetical protein